MSHVALLITLLGRTDLFRSLSEVDRGAVAGQMREVTYESGQLIFGRGDPGEEMHLVVEGRVRLSVLSAEGKVLSFAHAGRGDIFGEIATLDGRRRTADATALTDVTTALLARSSLKSLMEAKPQLAQAAIGRLCQRLRVTSEQIETIALHSTQGASRALSIGGRSHEGQRSSKFAAGCPRSRHVADGIGFAPGRQSNKN